MNFYNDNDPKICAWLRELIKAKLIPDGIVDSRSIELIQPDELKPYIQCHFFAGIGGWSEALRLAGWPVDAPVWTGSCPCQPFSCAGKGKGADDARHLWPEFRRLIAACQPPVVFGEQVASNAGREWLAGIRADLEGTGYAVGAADLCAASVGSPQPRQRLYWMAYATSLGCSRRAKHNGGAESCDRRKEAIRRGSAIEAPKYSPALRVAWGNDWVECHDGRKRRIEPGAFPLAHGVPARMGRLRGYGNAIVPQVAAQFIGAYMDINPLPL